jgi:hypothetical protein
MALKLGFQSEKQGFVLSGNSAPSQQVYRCVTKSLEALLPVLYLRGVSTGDFQEALAALLSKAPPARLAS